jgi:hypothetical protein
MRIFVKVVSVTVMIVGSIFATIGLIEIKGNEDLPAISSIAILLCGGLTAVLFSGLAWVLVEDHRDVSP